MKHACYRLESCLRPHKKFRHSFLTRLFSPYNQACMQKQNDPANCEVVGFEMVPEARVELARRETTVFETAASAIPPLGHVALAL